MLKYLQNILRQRRDDGETNQSIADSCGMSQQRINEYLNGDAEQIGKMRLSAALRLFPFPFRDAAIAPPALTESESRLLAAYRQADETGRSMLDALASTIIAKSKRAQSTESKEVAND